MVDVDKKVIDMISFVSPEERNALLKMLDVTRAEPTVRLSLAIFRDIYMFKQMSQALIIQYKNKLVELEHRIEELEERMEKHGVKANSSQH